MHRSGRKEPRWPNRRRLARRLLPALALGSIALLCLASPASAGDVAVLMGANVGPYKEALEGFEKNLAGHEVVKTFDMDGDQEKGIEKVREIEDELKPDLIFAVGVWALQAIMQTPTHTPVVFAMVLNPPTVLGNGPANVTGASMNVPPKASLQRLRELGPQIKRVGLVYNPAKTGYLVTEARAIAGSQGIELITKEVNTPGDVVPALEALASENIDAFWILPDETVLAPAVTKHVFLYSYRNKIPVMGLSEHQARMGAVLALSAASNEDMGRQAAELANAILGGRKPSAVPYTTAREVHLTVNLKVAKKIGVTVPDDLIGSADTVIR